MRPLRTPRALLLTSLLALFALGAPFLGPARSLHATSFFLVTNLNDSGPGSLRQAINDAGTTNATISFGVSGTILLTSGALIIADTSGLQIIGTGVSISVSGNGSSGVFTISSGASASLSDLSVIDGLRFHGGAILNNGGLSLTGVTVNRALAAAGGCIYNTGTLSIQTSTLSQCLANNGPGGLGGGIDNVGGTLTLTNSTIDGAAAVNSGGGIANFANGTVSMTASTITRAIVGVEGAGMLNFLGTVTISNSTISRNLANNLNGGGINNHSTLSLLNSTISDNAAFLFGGGIFNTGSLTIGDDIVAGNIDGAGGSDSWSDCRSALPGSVYTNQGYNVLGAGTGCAAISSDRTVAPGDVRTTVLSRIADNGGPTQTQALIPGSPAIDLVPVSGAGCPATDQRGTTRPQGSGCDAGAYELRVTAPATAAVSIVLPTGPLATIMTSGCGSVTPPTIPAGLGPGATVMVMAVPCAGSTFLGWTGGPCDGTAKNPCVITILTGALPVITANFVP